MSDIQRERLAVNVLQLWSTIRYDEDTDEVGMETAVRDFIADVRAYDARHDMELEYVSFGEHKDRYRVAGVKGNPMDDDRPEVMVEDTSTHALRVFFGHIRQQVCRVCGKDADSVDGSGYCDECRPMVKRVAPATSDSKAIEALGRIIDFIDAEGGRLRSESWRVVRDIATRAQADHDAAQLKAALADYVIETVCAWDEGDAELGRVIRQETSRYVRLRERRDALEPQQGASS